MTELKHFSDSMSILFSKWYKDSPRLGEPGGAGIHLSSWTVLTSMSSMYQTIARIVTALVGVGLMFILYKSRTLTVPLPLGAAEGLYSSGPVAVKLVNQ